MTFDEYWERLVAKNPSLANDENGMKMTVGSFKKALRQSFDMARKPPDMPNLSGGESFPDLLRKFTRGGL